ncbi:hypothetical protein NPIL_439021 [Nephila pilipes]|uniref:C2H2-type domain-containing protein n=1 Tax=Nephila pilipes TaxID=299642 RepID=A0A8X6PN31_NEPPI|nr:hypothetical protein NPIL_439021 [Nephila pilipes]
MSDSSPKRTENHEAYPSPETEVTKLHKTQICVTVVSEVDEHCRMNRKPWKCCGKTFSDYTKYYAHVLIFHNENADYERTNASNKNGRTTLDESKDGCSKKIRVTKNTIGMNEYNKDISVVD